MKKIWELITNRYAIALGIIAMAALLCLVSTSQWTMGIIIVKAIGFGLIYAYVRLFKKWDSEGKVNIIRELFNDDHDED